MKSRIKYCFFDLFFTLVAPDCFLNEVEYIQENTNLSIKEWDKISSEVYHDRAVGKVNTPEDIIFQILNQAKISLDKETINKIKDMRIEKFRKTLINVEKSILSSLELLRKNGYKLCLVSNADVIDKMHWNESPLAKYFDVAIFSCDLGFIKPQEEIYLQALARMGASTSESVFIGDGGHNELFGAKEIGFKTILTKQFTINLWPEKLKELSAHADLVIDDLSELLKII